MHAAATRAIATGPTLSLTCNCCKRPFDRGVDVKLCSTCGRPHHATCWAFGDGCQSPKCRGVAEPIEVARERCGCCGASVRADAEYCERCGLKVPRAASSSSPAPARVSPWRRRADARAYALGAMALAAWIVWLLGA